MNDERSSDGQPPVGAGGAGSPSGATEQPELIAWPGRRPTTGRPTEHLTANRALIVRRSLMAAAVGGVVPVPVMDDYLAGRVRAGMLMKIAERRRVDLAASSAELLADPREGTAVRNATLTAATLVALKLAWRKFFALLAVGRRAEDMTTSFQLGTVFDHFCAQMHVGSGVDRALAYRVRVAAHAAIADTERATLVGIFRDGARILGRSLLEAPAWVHGRLQRTVEQYVASGGNPDIAAEQGGLEADVSAEDARWIDRASALVEDRIGRLGNDYLAGLLTSFETHWAKQQTQADTGPDSTSSDQPSAPPRGAP